MFVGASAATVLAWAALALLTAALVLALAALASARRAQAETRKLRAELDALARESAALRHELARVASAGRAASTPPPAAGRESGVGITVPLAGARRASHPTPRPGVDGGVPSASAGEGDAAAPGTWTPPAETTAAAARHAGDAAGRVAPPLEQSAALRGAAALADSERAARASLEERIGVTWFTRVGAVVLVLGAAVGFKSAVDNAWLGPLGRVAVGLLAGVGVLAGAERLRDRLERAYVHALLGVGLALVYVATYAACGFYQLLPATAAFAALIVVAAAGGAFSVRHRSEPTLVIALAAALANPVLLAPGPEHAAAVLGYVFVASGAAAYLALRMHFARALWLAVGGAALLAGLWRTGWLGAGGATALASPWLPLGFAAAFTALWTALAIGAHRDGFAAARPARVLAGALAFAHLAAAALLWDAPERVAAAMVGCALYAALAAGAVGRSAPTLVGTAALGAVLLALRGAPPAAARGGWVALVAAWALVHLGAAARAMRAREDGAPRGTSSPPPPRLDADVVALALVGPLGFFALALRATGGGESGARAAAAAGAAVALVGFDVAVRAYTPALRARAAPLWGAPAALAVVAVGLALEGAWITLVWAALGLALARTAARWEARPLGAAALALFALVLARVLAVDAWGGAQLAAQFRESLGAAGSLRPPGVASGRTAALLGTAAALWRAGGRGASAALGTRGAAGLVACGHALAALWLLLTVRAGVTDFPPLPAAVTGPDPTAFYDALARFDAHVEAQLGRRAVASTIALGAYGAGLLAGGFALRSALHRWLGLGAIGLTVVKLAAWDIWMVARPFRVVVLVTVGVLLLGAGFLYARFGHRLMGLLRARPPDTSPR